MRGMVRFLVSVVTGGLGRVMVGVGSFCFLCLVMMALFLALVMTRWAWVSGHGVHGGGFVLMMLGMVMAWYGGFGGFDLVEHEVMVILVPWVDCDGGLVVQMALALALVGFSVGFSGFWW